MLSARIKRSLCARGARRVVGAALLLASCGRSDSGTSDGSFAGPVVIDGGRKLYLECHGEGAPTVVLVSGLLDRAETWTTTLAPVEQAVLPAVAATTRVCAYDRPGTIVAVGGGAEDFEKSRSDAAPQPITPEVAVADLHALLAASREPGPYVLVGHSAGGAFAKHYASQYPREVSGLVLVDHLPYELRSGLTDEQWTYWKAVSSPSQAALAMYPEQERLDHQRGLDQVLAEARLTPLPLVVLSSDKPFDLTSFVDSGLLPAAIAADFGKAVFQSVLNARANLVSQVPGATHITNTNSGHYIHQEHPRLVSDSVIEVVNAVREGRLRPAP